MRCEMCGEDLDVIVLLPIRQPDGRFETLVCGACAEKSPAYCAKHCRPHLGFEDDTHACIACIEEEVNKRRVCAEHYYDLMRCSLSPDELERLEEWLEPASFITGDADEVCILRAVVTRALRLGQVPESVFASMLREKSVASILPHIMA